MKIVEDISYNIDDVISQINDSFGFRYVEETDHTGYIILSRGIRLIIEFNESERKLDTAELLFPESRLDLVKDRNQVEIYASSIESATQIVDLILRMLGDSSDDQNT